MNQPTTEDGALCRKQHSNLSGVTSETCHRYQSSAWQKIVHTAEHSRTPTFERHREGEARCRMVASLCGISSSYELCLHDPVWEFNAASAMKCVSRSQASLQAVSLMWSRPANVLLQSLQGSFHRLTQSSPTAEKWQKRCKRGERKGNRETALGEAGEAGWHSISQHTLMQ